MGEDVLAPYLQLKLNAQPMWYNLACFASHYDSFGVTPLEFFVVGG